ncbi:hypothetical protein ACFQBQ_10775 [Granulicella cerasi]|uniref:PHP domain-containing protein n=1 Tax=Granulicella cerasi TaxID=741063 RepID=A0ABW1ZA50_9BACT|nr:hypothetical protein [Granulicella cerasi]
MQTRTQVTTNWKDSNAIAKYATGVSLHSHTSVSEETLDFVHSACAWIPGLKPVLDKYSKLSRERYGIELNFERANWRPPLQPRMAYELEAQQIAALWLQPLVSLTDHDSMEAPQLLRTLPSSRHIPMSTEWSAPFGESVFHLGVHNLPTRHAAAWMQRFAAYTAAAHEARRQQQNVTALDAQLVTMLRELHEIDQVLLVLNHPSWDLHKVGAALHLREVRRFLSLAGGCVHALELNGLRHAQENHEVARLARELGYLLISGGDRHGLEANANINLTSAATFSEFVEEIRVDRVSHVHFMNQYRDPWEQRIVASTLDAVTDFPQFMAGWQRWDERVFHPDANGIMRPASELWPDGRVPLGLRAAIAFVKLGRTRAMSRPISLAFPGVNAIEVEGF